MSMIDSLITQFSKRAYLPALDRWKGIDVARAYAATRQNGRGTPESLQREALRALREIVTHAERHCAFYAASFSRAGVSSDDIVELEDLRRVPMLSKADIFEHRDDLRDRNGSGPTFRCSTSGSTGVSMVFYTDAEHLAWVEASVLRGRAWWGVSRGDPEFVLWARAVDDSPTKDVRAALKYRLRNRVQYDTFVDFDERRAEEIVSAIRRRRPRVLYGYGSSLGRLATWMNDKGWVLEPGERPVVVEYTADHMSASERFAGEQVFGAPVLSAYGASEVGGVAQQCREGRLHMSIDHAWVEFLRPDGARAEPGESAEIVLTTLRNRTMPLIRYRVGDVGTYSLEPCPCGSPLPVMELHLGKAVELVETSSVRGMSAHVFDYINLHLIKIGIPGIRQFFVEQRALDDFELQVVRDRRFDPRCTDIFVAKMRERLGAEIRVDIRFVDEVPRRPSGKRLYFRKTFESVPETSPR